MNATPLQPLTMLGDIPVEQFLSEYWQKKPLLVRNAFPGFRSPLSPEELAGLAMEEAVESRLVFEHGEDGPWQLKNGPFTEEEFLQTPESHWTLLVQAVDQWVPEIAQLLEPFRFLPSWRLDDIMISYAADKGSVGPHFDFYDVFLLQAEGKRRWQVGGLVDADSPRVEGTPLNILREFEPLQDWELEPGDMLYLPPQVSHWGTAVGPCTTISVGFRAPSAKMLLEDLCGDLAQQIPDSTRFTDAAIDPKQAQGEIRPDAVSQVRDLIIRQMDNPAFIARWFGELMTEVKYPEVVAAEAGLAENWREQVAEHPLVLNSSSRCAFAREPGFLFVDGDSYPAPVDFCEAFCASQVIDRDTLEKWPFLMETNGLVDQLVNHGALHLPLDDEHQEE